MYIIYKIENHPDRILEDFYGPFESYGEAQQYGETLDNDKSNWNGSHRLYNHVVAGLEKPVI